MIKWKANFRWIGDGITPVECERESEQCVWINSRRIAKRSDYDNYFDTWEEAHAFLLGRAEGALQSARRMLGRAQGTHGNVKGMRKPHEPVSSEAEASLPGRSSARATSTGAA